MTVPVVSRKVWNSELTTLDNNGDGDEDDNEMLPPHEIVARVGAAQRDRGGGGTGTKKYFGDRGRGHQPSAPPRPIAIPRLD
ncbi:hypothetical protein Acr_03g0009670 [Actinidia rufa]|uniref:Uncharacterized protein n=1 Tax=Actinidia rufa TaxID=165716 RepID=A0A7J0ECJ5_9ERIC|nr:hypothetical protein Acr_03g0009670 [Actinidia rufa]